jgi:hypothetical protein
MDDMDEKNGRPCAEVILVREMVTFCIRSTNADVCGAYCWQ